MLGRNLHYLVNQLWLTHPYVFQFITEFKIGRKNSPNSNSPDILLPITVNNKNVFEPIIVVSRDIQDV